MSEEGFMDILRRRRSIRSYREEPLPDRVVETLVEAVLRSPSSRGLSPWGFVFVDDEDVIEELSRCKQHGSGFLAGAPLAVAIAADESVSDVWIEDCSIAAIILQLQCEDLGLGSCWVQVRRRPHDGEMSAEEHVRQTLGLPEDFRVLCIVGIGYPDEEKEPVPEERLFHSRIHRNGWR